MRSKYLTTCPLKRSSGESLFLTHAHATYNRNFLRKHKRMCSDTVIESFIVGFGYRCFSTKKHRCDYITTCSQRDHSNIRVGSVDRGGAPTARSSNGWPSPAWSKSVRGAPEGHRPNHGFQNSRNGVSLFYLKPVVRTVQDNRSVLTTRQC